MIDSLYAVLFKLIYFRGQDDTAAAAENEHVGRAVFPEQVQQEPEVLVVPPLV